MGTDWRSEARMKAREVSKNSQMPLGSSDDSVTTTSPSPLRKEESPTRPTLDSNGKGVSVEAHNRLEFSAKDVQSILRYLTGGTEKIGLALLNYYARTNLVPTTGSTLIRGRRKYSYSDLILLCWLFRMKREGLPVNRFRRGIDYLRKKLPKLYKSPTDMVLLTDGRQLFIKHRVEDRNQIAEVLTGKKAGQYVWAYAIGSLIEEVDEIIERNFESPQLFTNEKESSGKAA